MQKIWYDINRKVLYITVLIMLGSHLISFSQVKLRILMGTYALSAGYYDAYYKRAQQVEL